MLRLAVILLLFTVVQVQGTCDEGYFQFTGSSDCFSLKPNQGGQIRVTWMDARSECNNDGATLASIKSLNDQVYLNVFLNTASASEGVWIGLRASNDSGDYEWIDGNALGGFENWGTDQPNSSVSPGNRCVQILPDDKTPGLWKTVNCNEANTIYYFCQKDPVDNNSPVQPGCEANSDYFFYDGTCFMNISGSMSYDEARTACQQTSPNADLAAVNNVYHKNVVQLLMLSSNITSAWIGLRSDRGRFIWEDRTQNVKYTNWAAMQPQPSDTNACVSTDGDAWTCEDCNEMKPAICSIPIDTNTDTKFQGECPDGWGIVGYECFTYVSVNMAWENAQQHCEGLYPGASLYTAHSAQPINWQEYGVFPGSEFWLGMTRNDDNKFEIIDGSIVDYVNWKPGEPSSDPNKDCVIGAVPQTDAFTWSSADCSIGRRFFCSFLSISSPPDTGECQAGWLKVDNKCYRYFEDEMTFIEAQISCESKAIGGNLAAITYGGLQEILTYAMRGFARDVWIGLQDTFNSRDFKWTTGDALVYTNWAPGQPDGYLDFFDDSLDRNDCAKMIADSVSPGLWDDVSCSSTKLPYFCECYLDRLLLPSTPNPNLSCPPGYVEGFPGSCYRLIVKSQTYEESLIECQNDKASLASVADGYEQGVLQYFLSSSDNAGTTMWIGMDDMDKNGEYTWTDGSPVRYVNWLSANSPQPRMCVAAQKSAKWLESDCNETRPAMCRTTSDIPVTPPPGETHCDDGWVHYSNSNPRLCYLINTYRLPSGAVSSTQYVTYAEAKQLCETQGAILATVHSPDQNDWLYRNIRVTLGKRKIWLGMHRSIDGPLQWDNGDAVNYVFWANGEPSNGQEGTDCVTFFAGNDGVGPWSDSSCFERNAFVCQKVANDGPKPQCESGWEELAGSCFYFRIPQDGVLDWHNAEAFCNQQGSNLASLSSPTERESVSQILRNRYATNPESWPWIGFRRLPYDQDFIWSDGTPLNVGSTSWRNGQPDNIDDDCVVIESEGTATLWNDINCGLSRPFICKKPIDSGGLPTPGTTQDPRGACKGDESRIGSHCYKLVLEPQNWESARDECSKLGRNGDLASVPIYAVQALIASLVKYAPVDNIWLGMTSKMPASNFVREFHWVDGSSLTFTNWGSGQPSLSISQDSCVKMLTDPDEPGEWYDDKCDKVYSYICKYDLDPNAGPQPPVSFAPCPSSFVGTPPSCFRIEETERPFSTALDGCEAVGGILAPVMDGYENAFIELLMYNSGIKSLWVGLRADDSTSSKYEWTAEQWPIQYINWAYGEPSLVQGCVASVYSEGWKSVDCSSARPSLCRSKTDTPPTFPPVDPGLDCPEKWYAFNKKCYLVSTGFTGDNLVNAFFKCSTIKALPVSIHSWDENNFIRMNALNELTGRFVWLGLVLEQGRYSWMDGSLVDFTNWEDGEDPTLNDGKKCVVMVPESNGRWRRQDCSELAEVVCMLNEYEPSTPSAPTDGPKPPTKPNPTKVPVTKAPSGGLSTGAIVGISIGGAAVLVIFVIWLCYFCEKQKNNRKEWERRQRNDDIDEDYGVENVKYSHDIELRKKKVEKDVEKVETKSDGSSNKSDSISVASSNPSEDMHL
ncbi:macrophage mannose receptor 1-like [Acanthaster planci]|uniref:Macrophage mannose receptor 1-like n=1 Tax=Acanthaster planci TaxID=133434 RepID=A0A8B7ZXM4_ACAPL|nr:macrophage mannose receptor 1-like [Acanthaster planci]